MVVASGDVRLPRFLRRQAGAEVDRLYRRHADEVLRYALMVMRSRPDAEDVVQIVFVRALRAIERGEKVRMPRNWLIKIAHNECRRLLSTRKVHAELPDEIAVEPIETGQAAELRKAMSALPEAQRKALCLRELEGRTYVEIATELGVTVSAVETLIFRARRTLREQLEASMSCEDFALLLDDPSARSRIRAHARVCPECATLERQARGRKSALKRIASMLGLPMWGAKLAAVGLTAAAVVATAAPVHQPKLIPHSRNLIPRSGTRLGGFAPRPVVAKPHARKVSDTHPVSDTRAVAAPVKPRPVAAAPASAPTPAPPSSPDSPATPLPPAAAVPPEPAAPAAPTPAPTVAPVAPDPVALPSVAPPPVETPAVPTVPAATPPVDTPTLPAITLPVPVPTVPSVTVPVETPKVSLP